MKLTKFELQKLIEPFTVVVLIIITALSSFMIYNVYNQGQAFALYNGESYHYRGKEYIDNNKKYAYQYSGRIVDDNFFLDLDIQYYESVIFQNGEQNIESYPIIISSVLQYYHQIPETTDIVMHGEITTDVNSVFKGELPVFEYTDNWKTIRGILPNIQLLLTIFAVMLSSLTFSKEYNSGMTPIILPAENGRENFAVTKIKTFYIFISAVYLIVTVIVIIASGFLWGFENPFADIRVITSGAYISMENPILCVTLILFQVIMGFLAIVIISSVGILISSIVKSPYISMVITAGVFFFPLLIKLEDIQSELIQQIVMLMPYNIPSILSSLWSIFDYSSMAVIIVSSLAVCIAGALSVLSVKIYSGHKIS